MLIEISQLKSEKASAGTEALLKNNGLSIILCRSKFKQKNQIHQIDFGFDDTF